MTTLVFPYLNELVALLLEAVGLLDLRLRGLRELLVADVVGQALRRLEDLDERPRGLEGVVLVGEAERRLEALDRHFKALDLVVRALVGGDLLAQKLDERYDEVLLVRRDLRRRGGVRCVTHGVRLELSKNTVRFGASEDESKPRNSHATKGMVYLGGCQVLDIKCQLRVAFINTASKQVAKGWEEGLTPDQIQALRRVKYAKRADERLDEHSRVELPKRSWQEGANPI